MPQNGRARMGSQSPPARSPPKSPPPPAPEDANRRAAPADSSDRSGGDVDNHDNRVEHWRDPLPRVSLQCQRRLPSALDGPSLLRAVMLLASNYLKSSCWFNLNWSVCWDFSC